MSTALTIQPRSIALDKRTSRLYAVQQERYPPWSAPMNADLAPVAKIPHAAFHTFLARQPWPCWAVDTAELEPLVAYQPVTLTRLMRVLRSHYTYSDLYIFNAMSTEEQIEAIDWYQISSIDAATMTRYVITHTVGQPFLGIAGSFDAAQRGAIIIIMPALGISTGGNGGGGEGRKAVADH
jgi:hypothetical protein